MGEGEIASKAMKTQQISVMESVAYPTAGLMDYPGPGDLSFSAATVEGSERGVEGDFLSGVGKGEIVTKRALAICTIESKAYLTAGLMDKNWCWGSVSRI